MATKRGRLTIIVVVAVAIIAAVGALGAFSNRQSDREARSFASSVEAKLGRYEREDLDELRVKDSAAGWAGERSPLMVEGNLPERFADVDQGVVLRYRIRAGGRERCVDALWPDRGRFSVVVNDCEGYERPGAG